MKRFIHLFAFLVIASFTAHAQSVAGDWLGKLDAGVMKLRIAFHLHAEAATITGTMDSLDQNVKGIPIQSASQNGAKVVLTLSMARFEGTLSATGDEIEGTWTQGGASLPLTVRRVTDASAFELPRPQNPAKPYPYGSEDVSYDNRTANFRLAGTLTLPRGKGPFPAALLITGSGPQDRDESIMGHKPFLVLADYLTRRGIAVLRVDDRGVGQSGGNFATATTADFATDVEAGVAYLKTRAEIDSHNIGLIGHSEGGVIAPMVAARDRDVAFIVLMAGSGVPGDQLIVSQVGAIDAASGASAADVRKATDLEREILGIIKAEPDNAAAEKRVRTLLAGKAADAQIAAQLRAMTTPWYRYFLSYDPRPALEKVKCPVLAIGGEKDLQVPAKENLSAIRKALEAGGNKDFETIELPGLNHLLQPARTGLMKEYAETQETISPAALETISGWIEKHLARKTSAALK